MPKQAGAAKTTTDHDQIRRWVEARGGCPATVKSTKRPGDPGLIRIDYTGFSGKQTLVPISWREFFQAFDDNKLAFLYQERTATGRISRFSKLVERGTARGAGARARKTRTSKTGTRRTTAKRGRKTATPRRTAAKSSTRRGGSKRRGNAKRTRGRSAAR